MLKRLKGILLTIIVGTGLSVFCILFKERVQANGASTDGYYYMLCATFNADAPERISFEGQKNDGSTVGGNILILNFSRRGAIQHCTTLELRHNTGGVVEYLLWPRSELGMKNLEIHYRPQSHTPKYTPPIASTPIPLTDGAYRFRVEADVVRTVPTVSISKVCPSSL